MVCPDTRRVLTLEGNHLVGGARRYPVEHGRANFLQQTIDASAVHRTPSEVVRRANAVAARLRLDDDGRTDAARRAYQDLVHSVQPGELAVCLGGGPGPAPQGFLNLNIFAAEGVDVVADCRRLPWADGVVSAICCEALLEHVRQPAVAVAEMFRVLRPGGRVLAVTPFLQGFHGVPDHFQNFTLSGHRALFEDAGFVVEEAGVCTGPLHALSTLLAMQLGYLSRSVWARRAGLLAARVAAKLDRPLSRALQPEYLCSSTYVLAARLRA